MGTLVASSVSSWATQPVQWGSTISDGFRIFRFHIESAWKNSGGMPSPTLAITGGSSDIVQCDIMRHSLWQKHLKSTNPLLLSRSSREVPDSSCNFQTRRSRWLVVEIFFSDCFADQEKTQKRPKEQTNIRYMQDNGSSRNRSSEEMRRGRDWDRSQF